MPNDENLLIRLREVLINEVNIEEKKMFGGVCFMINGKMCLCARNQEIMCRLDPESYQDSLERNGTRQMIHNGRVMKGYVYVDSQELKSKDQLYHWVKLALDFNEKAKSLPKRRKQ
jgi:TfoX/Sxy family transcriptional regulator of competence genes